MSAIKLDYGGIKELAKELRRPASTLYALAAGNDPFYITPGQGWMPLVKLAAGFAPGVIPPPGE